MRNRSKIEKSPWAAIAIRAAGMAPSRIVAPSFRFKPLIIGSPHPPPPNRAASVAEPMVMMIAARLYASGENGGRRQRPGKIFRRRVRGFRASTPAASRKLRGNITQAGGGISYDRQQSIQ